MKRFVTYMYEYDGIKKGKNTGFVKTDLLDAECRMEIHIRGLNGFTGKAVVLLIIEDSGLIGYELGDMVISKGQGDYGTIIRKNGIGETDYGFSQIAGIGVIYGEDGLAASKWKEDPNIVFSRKGIRLWEPKQLEPEKEFRQEVENRTEILNNRKKNDEDKEKDKDEQIEYKSTIDQKQKDTILQDENMEEDKAQHKTTTSEIPQVQATNIFPQENWIQKWETLAQTLEPVELRKEYGGTWRKTDVKGIRELPKRTWYMGNNSFLLHGFFNYHYIIVGKENQNGKDVWMIGVPGFYQQQERIMATIFGFPEFYSTEKREKNSSSPQNNPQAENESFGYWIHMMDLV